MSSSSSSSSCCSAKSMPPRCPHEPALGRFSTSSSNAFPKLSAEIYRLANSTKQSGDLFIRKKMIRQIVYNTLRAHSFQPIDIYLVGSSLNGLGTNTSDIDLCLVMNSFGVGYCHMRVAVPILRWAEKILSKLAFVKSPKLILAKVPILKFTDAESGLEVDLNFNNIVGVRNTQLVEFYNRLDKRVQPLVLTVKTWARQNNINNARNRTLSSYSFVLMVLHYLQCGCDPPVLPCLHKMMPGKFRADSDITKLSLFEETPPFESVNTDSLGQLFAGFLFYFGYIFNFEADVLSVRMGSVIPKSVAKEYSSPKNSPRQWSYIGIEEPFDRTNTAKSVYDSESFNRILSVFRLSHAKIIKTRSLLSVMNLSGRLEEQDANIDGGSDGYPARKVRLHEHYTPYFVYQQPPYLPIYPGAV